MLGFRERYVGATVAAQVIAASGSEQSRVLTIDKGSRDGIKPDMAVITQDGVVGKIRDVDPTTAHILEINDQTSGAGVLLESTRIRAILRRYEPRTSVGARLAVNGVALDPATRQVTVDGEAVDLTTFEFDILDLLMRAAGRVLSRDDLMENLYNRQATAFDRSIDMHVSHIRRKLETKRPFIKPIRGVGYQFLKSPQDEAAE